MMLVLLKLNGHKVTQSSSGDIYVLVETADVKIIASVTRASFCVVKETHISAIHSYWDMIG